MPHAVSVYPCCGGAGGKGGRGLRRTQGRVSCMGLCCCGRSAVWICSWIVCLICRAAGPEAGLEIYVTAVREDVLKSARGNMCALMCAALSYLHFLCQNVQGWVKECLCLYCMHSLVKQLPVKNWPTTRAVLTCICSSRSSRSTSLMRV